MTSNQSGMMRTRGRRAAAFALAVAVVASGMTFATGLGSVAPAQAVFAEGGTGDHRNSIDWFDFQTAGQIVADGQEYTNTRLIGNDELRSTCKITQVIPAGEAVTYRPGDYIGDGLPNLYYRGGPGPANTLVNAISNKTYGGEVEFDFACSAEYVPSNTGVPISVPLQGLVVADAESSSSTTDEFVSVTPHPDALGEQATWYMMDRWRPENCDASVALTPGADGSLTFRPTAPECLNVNTFSGPMAVGFMKGATKATVKLKGGGHSAVALGMVMSTDFGDAPSEFFTEAGTTIPLFGEAGAIYQPAWEGAEIGSEPRDLFDPALQLATPTIPSLHLGQKIDAEVEHQSSWDALLDDETGESDEDGIPLASLPQITEGQPLNATNSIDVSCSADASAGGWVSGWLDWNRNGSFDSAERSTPVQCIGQDQTVTMTWPGLGVLEATTSPFAPVVYLRVRIAETADGLTPEGVLVPTGVGSAGEVEDYALGVPLIEAYKESAPISNVPQAAGDVVRYELTFRNVGEIPGPIVYRDFLEDVLDDATFNTGSAAATASAGSPITLTEPTAANQWLGIDGEMQPGETVTIRYEVTVNDPVTEGAKLANYLLHINEDGTLAEPRPETCEVGNPRCTTHPLVYPKLDVSKTAIPGSGQAVEAGQTITYHLDFRNSGTAPTTVDYTDDLSKVLPYADIQPDRVIVVGDALTATLDAGAQSVHIAGDLPGGGYTRVTVVAKLKDELPADLTSVDNFLHETGTEPPAECLPESELCTTHPIELPDLKISKSADPMSGTLVSAGDQLTYTLTFDNSNGAAAARVHHVDDLTRVLDDATFGSVTSASSGLDTDGPTAGKLRITGAVPAGAVSTVSYTVTVNEDGERGDDTLANFLMDEGADPPTTCEAEDPTCTTHPAGDPKLVLVKTADPASGEPVVAGQTVSYTLSFDNEAGTAPAEVAHTDDLSDVLDDAAFVSDSLTATGGLVATGPDSNGKLSITGTLPAGGKATVKYSVTVNDPVVDGATLANFLFAGDEKPEVCNPGDPCTVHPGTKPDLHVEKTSDPETGTEVAEGDAITYQLKFTNDGTAPATVAHTDDLTGVLDDAELAGQPTVTPAGALTGAIADGKLDIAGTLASGATATVSYTVEVLPEAERGDHTLANYLIPTGTDPPTVCDPASKLCTVHPVPLPDLTVKKTVNVGTETPVNAGDVLTYSLEFDNTDGEAPAPVKHLDDLSGVIDDADFDEASLVAPAGLNATWSAGDATISVSGTVPAGEKLVVTYQVTVKADGERGDNQIQNFLFEDGQDPPTVCTPAENCTTNPIPELKLAKSADPASGEAVASGDVVTYTLTFDNSAGKAPAPVDHTDDLADVLDDATFVDGSLTASSGLIATGPTDDALTITGAVSAGETLTVTYSVTVNDEADRGNNSLSNFLFAGDEKPGVCEPGDPCTTHPVSAITYQKLVTDPNPSPAVPGSEIGYIIRITNTGEAPGVVSRVDDLSDVLDDADLTGAPESDTESVTVTGPTGEKLTIGGTLGAGETALVSYTVTVKEVADQGNHQAINFLLKPGTEPPTVCDPETEQCTITEWPNLTAQKTSDPESGTVLHAGDQVTYTLRFENTGTAPVVVNYVDHRAQALANASLDGTATPSGGLAVDESNPHQLAVTGELAPKATGTVTYTVTVVDTSGLSRLTNFLTPEGTNPPGVCKPETELCTDHPIVAPGVDVQKTAKPASTQPVSDGQIVTYALRFWNWSPTAAPISYEDLLGDVLDDADLVTPPGVTSGDGTGVTVLTEETGNPRAPRILVSSPGLATDQEFVVTYQVKVDLSKGGNKQLGNFVLEEGEDPGVCEPSDWHCTTHPAGKLELDKQVNPASGTPVAAGQELEYTLTFTNSGTAPVQVNHVDALAGVLDDASWNDTLAIDPATTGLTATFDALNERIRIAGDLAAGDTVTVTYTVTVNPDGERGDNELANFLLAGNPPNPPICDPTSGDICTTNPVPNLVLSKTSDPASGEAVATGEVLKYTLTFDNSAGKAPALVAHTDDLSDVLDDATFVENSLTAETPLTATGPGAADEIAIAGEVPAGATLTVTYEVTVKSEAERLEQGNNSLANFLFDGDEAPEVCVPGDPCTVHPAPNLQLRKSVDPASGETVEAGDELTYTLTFDNSQGTAPATVAHRDDLSGVLDDARFVAGSLTPAAGLSAIGPDSGGVIQIAGTVPAGETLTVTYRVEVLPDGERGDNQLANFLLMPGVVDPPVTCEIEDPTCTTNPIPEVSYVKEVVASDEPILAGKTTLSYTVTVTNTGTATGKVARTDDLSDVLDDATIVTQPVSDTDSVTVTEIADEKFSIGGTLAAGETAKITYTVRVKAAANQGNSQAANFLLPPGITEPPVTCEPGDLECTETPLPAIRPAKSAVTESGETWLRAGEAVTYTLTFENSGTAAGPVSYWDGLRDVLTYAHFEGDIVVNQGGGSTVDAVFNAEEERIEIAGNLAAGQTASVTYKMRLEADLPHGARVTNYLVEQGESLDLPACFPDEGMICTDHPAVMPGLDVSKSADPASGTEVREGDEITYTLLFDAWGPDRAVVNHRDMLSDVVDDAELLGQPVVAIDGNGTLKAVVARGANGQARIDVRGSLKAGSHATVTYTVRVLPDRERPASPAAPGTTPHHLANFVIGSGEEPPTVCTPNASDCTVHPIETKPNIEVTKSVDPESGTAVAAGDRLSYKLGFTNWGTANGEVDFEDRLADVLDDAKLVSGPTVDGEGVSATVNGDLLRIVGELAPKQTVTVIYTVEVLPVAAEPPSVLVNFVVKPGDQTPEVCNPTQTPCTANPVIPKDPNQPIPKPPLVETGGVSPLPWILSGAGLLLIGGVLLTLVVRRKLRNPGDARRVGEFQGAQES